MKVLTGFSFTRYIGIPICLVFQLLFGSLTFAQDPGNEIGLPFITNYTPKQFNTAPQMWAIAEDNRGVMYFGAQSALLEYDGITWKRVRFPDRPPALIRSMAKSENGRIYYGAAGDFGYLAQDSTGQTYAISLQNLIPADKRNFFDVWTINIAKEGIYFQSREYIFRLNDKNELKIWEPKTKFMYAFYYDGNYFVHEQGVGFLKLVSDSLQLIPGSEFLGQERTQVMLPFDDGDPTTKKYLLGSFYAGLYLFDGNSFQPFKTDVDELIKSATLYKGIAFPDGTYGLSTTGKGIAIINKEGKLLQMINRGVGLQDESVYAVYFSHDGTFWMALDNGISRMEIESPFTQFTNQSGISTATLSLARYQGKLYLGTTNGLLSFNDHTQKFEPDFVVPPNQTFNLINDGKELLVANDGLFAIQNNKTYVIQPSISGNLQLSGLTLSTKHPTLLLGGSTFGVAIFYRKNPEDHWKFIGHIPNLDDQFWTFCDADEKSFWAGTQSGVVYKVFPAFKADGTPDLDKFTYKKYGEESGLINVVGQVNEFYGDPVFVGDTVMYRFNEKTQRFYADTAFGKLENGGGTNEGDLVSDELGSYWFRWAKMSAKITKQPDGHLLVDKTPLIAINDRTFQKIIPEGKDILWICTTDGLIRYDSRLKKSYDQSYSTFFRKIVAGKRHMNPDQSDGAQPDLSFQNNQLRFEYAAPFFDKEEKTVFQTWLEGYEAGWSEWGNNYYKEYTNLSGGKYQFHVRAKNLYGKLSNEAIFQFTVLPPWYNTWWAYILYFLVGAGLIYYIVRSRTRQLHAKQKELEMLVNERTGELKERVEELAVINNVQEGLSRELNVQGIYEIVGNRVCELFDTQTVIIRSFDLEKQEEIWQYAIEKGARVYSEPRPLIWANQQIISSKKPLIINKDYVETAKKYGGTGVSMGMPPKSAIFVPLILNNQVKGSVSLQNIEKEYAFDDSVVRLLSTLSNSMIVALENARLFDETNYLLSEAKQRASELGAVNNISQALASHLNLDELINLVGEELKTLFKANIVYLALLDKDTNIINFSYQYGDNMAPLKLGEGLTSKIILTGKPLLINKDLQELRQQLGIQKIGLPAASYIGVPIPVGDEVIGVLSVQSTEHENRFDESDLRLMGTIAASVGVAIRKARLFEEIQQAKMDAEEARKVAEKANAAKSAFLSTVSHELRTPLTSVLGFAKIIRKRLEEKIFPITDKSDPKTQKTIDQVSENLNVVVSEGERLTHLINDVLDLAKIEAGKMEWNMEPLDIIEVVERAIAATTALFDQKNLRLEKEIAPNLPSVTGDRDKLIQVVVNLLSNAVKFTDSGIVSCRVEQRDNELVVSVTDTGIGIAPDDHDAVFEQFKQVGDTLTDKPKGTGLGLPICKEIVEHHGGHIWLDSELGRGSTFSFAIPAGARKEPVTRPVNLQELMRQLKEQMEQSKLKVEGRKANILIVDDDPSIRSLLEQELGEAGYVVEQAENGKEAISRIRLQRPDLVILDVMMPEMNGFDVAAILKNDPQTMDIPIIILSIVQDRARGFRIGVDRYLTKPIDTAQLFSEVGSLLEQGKSKKKVMVVDEDTTTVRTLSEVLQARGYQVFESSSEELMNNAISKQPDIIILNSMFREKQEIVQTLRFEKGMENVLFLVYQ